ncbi:RHS repeat-associated core domain-containing protein [Kutzneria buriramensis]|uniref:RHS repeat-associated protein n=1 Tax=Kutzneria buriramensis TaxID=1045776 RepID=A0A3E0I6P7_9PSEU|nr:RHS repeat-associated core domain-containing protein [Kutzneria buriramensis]REH54418.1 RHS repeat-associated protein [Kutzneria buriramensis]
MTSKEAIVRRTRRAIAGVLPAVLVTTALTLLTPTAAWAGEPSVPLQNTPSTPVSQQQMGTRPADQASGSELHGDQPASTDTKDGGGTDKATPLSPSASWNVSAQTGDFSWSYPLRVPPSAGKLDPKLAISYASSGVDGRTSATNNQASWIGDGWDLSVGFIERSYIPCSDDSTPVKVGDMCWRSDNAFASYGGGGGQLIRDDKTGVWKNKTDDGSRIERLTGANNGDNDGEYWRVTTVDGTQYLFGDRSDAKSTWTVPVYGNDAGEPCHGGTFDASQCTQAWRWNLDKVIDRHGNVIEYDYDTEANSYGADMKDSPVSYVRGGTLKEALYGLRDGSNQQATDRVEFTTADRCVPGSDCTPSKKDNWPDVPWDDKCDGSTCKDQNGPTFWSTKRLSQVTTQVLTGSTYADVESWSLDQQFPTNGDGEKPALWLKSITHTGKADGQPAITMPSVRFEGTKFANRVDKVDGLGPLLRYRVTAVVSETGGVTTITYAQPDCTADNLPAKPETNTMRCYPAKWQKKDFTPQTDYFNKYVVAQVTQSDMIAANTEDVTAYDYLDGAAWAYDTSEFTKDADRNWNEFRGFGRVRITKGKADDLAGPQTMTEERFYRGMDGDKQPSGTRSVSVTDSEGGVRKDDLWLAGFEYESQVHNGPSEQVMSKSIMTPSVQGPTSTRGSLKAYIVKPGVTVDYTALSAGGWRTTRTEQSYDDLGQLVSTNDLGDVSTPADDKCVRTTYVRNTDKWLIAFASQTETVSVACTTTPKYPDNAVSGARSSYDGKAFGVAPTAGDVTTAEVLDSYPASGAVYLKQSTAAFDAMGRVTSSGDALGNITTTAYTPASGGPLTQTVVTNPLNQATTTTIDSATGQTTKVVDANNRVTETAYDALGNRTEIWQPNRSRTAGQGGNAKFSYAYHNDAPTVVTTSSIGPNGQYTTVKDLYDGLLRLRQKQVDADGGRLITDTKYDSQGRQAKLTQPYFTASSVDDQLWIAADVDVPQQTVSQYDGAGRKTAEIVKGGADELRRTVMAYDGDRTTVTPPVGGTATTTIVDARNHTVELDQYHGRVPTGDFDATKYTYTPADKVATATDPAGNVWKRSYDLRGNETTDVDPDKGTTTITYTAANQLHTTTDARGVTLTYDYDKLGRKTGEKVGDAVQAQWTYDTAPFGKGQRASSTRFVNGNAYTATVLGYNTLYKSIGVQVAIPSSEGALSGTYTSTAKYDVDGSVSGAGFAAIGDLPAESLTFGYNDLAELTTVSGGFDGNTADYVTDTTYTRYGEVARTQLGDTGKRVWMSNYYDDHTRRLNRSIVDAEVPAPMQADTHYSYDQSGNITSIADTPQGKPADVQCFALDYLQRVSEAWTPSGDCSAAPSATALSGPAPYWQSFTYDKMGNRLTQTDHATAGDTVSTGTFASTGHSLSALATTGPAGATASQYLYDASGNTITRKLPGGTQQLTWDVEGRLATVAQGSDKTDFLYDADGTRLIEHDANGATLYLQGQELHLTKSSGKLEGTRYYQHGDTTVAMRTAAGVTWLSGDAQGTAMVAINADTLKVTQRRQLPFGGARGAADFPGDKGFVGGTIDKSVGLTQLGAREYDAALGRFLSVDPQLDLSDPQQMAGYTYSDDNPVTKMDPTGELWSWLKKATDWVGDRVSDVTHWAGDRISDGWKWVDKYKSQIGAVVSAVSLLVPGVGWVAAATMAIGIGLSGIDFVEAAKKGDYLTAGIDALSIISGPIALGMGRFAKQAAADSKDLINNKMFRAGRTVSQHAFDWETDAQAVNYGAAAGSGMVAVMYPPSDDDPESTGDSCGRPTPTTQGPYPCTQQKLANPLDNSWCNSGTGVCACWAAPPRASTPGGGRAAPSYSRPSYNLGPQRPGPNRQTYNSPEAIRTGIYETSDGLLHNRNGHGLAFF